MFILFVIGICCIISKIVFEDRYFKREVGGEGGCYGG